MFLALLIVGALALACCILNSIAAHRRHDELERRLDDYVGRRANR